MWDVLVRTPRGRLTGRKFSHALATLIVAIFGYSFFSAPVAAAADATWEGNDISYDGRTYEQVTSSDTLPTGVQSSPNIYQSVDSSVNPNLVYFIYFDDTVTDPKSEKEANYIRYTLNPPNRYINGTPVEQINIVPVTEELDTDDGTLSNECMVDGIGWVVCPLMQGVAEGMDLVYGFIQNFLVVQPISNSINNPIYRMWTYSRDLANIAFVIGFLVIIYSYLVGGGFNGYEIRKILPRLVVAAILINISYIVCAVAVDISNIAGASVNQLFETVRDDALSGSSSAGANVDWKNVTAWVLGGGTAAVVGGIAINTAVGGAAAGLWFLLAPFLLGAALLVMVTFIILAARQAIIIILIAIAPIAFAAYILPNTEKWFERWRGLFVTMLVMFPAFGAVFGGSQLAGEVIIRSASSIEIVILGLGVMVAPLAITPLLLKLGGGVLSRVGGVINNPRKGVYDRYKNYNNERRQDFVAKQNRLNARRDKDGNLLLGKNQFLRRSAYNRGLKDFNRKRLRDANNSSAERMYEDNDDGVESFRSRAGRQYAKARGRGDEYTPSYKYGSAEISELSMRSDALHKETEARHSAHWNRYFDVSDGHFDSDLYQQRLRTYESSQVAKRAEDRTNTTVRELEAGNADAVVDRIGSVTTREAVRDQIGKFSVNLQDLNREITAESERKQSADKELQTQITAAFNNNDVMVGGVPIRQYAAGIDVDFGQQRVLAAAKAAVTKELMTNTENFQNTLPYEISSDPDRLFELARETKLTSEKIAYSRLLAAMGTPGHDRLNTLLLEYPDRSNYPSDPIEREKFEADMLDYREIMATDRNFTDAGRDFEVWARNERKADKDATGKTIFRTYNDFADATNTMGIWSEISAQRWARMGKIKQEQSIALLSEQAPDNLRDLATRVVEDKTALSQLKGKPHRMIMNAAEGKDINAPRKDTPPETE